MPKFSQDSLDKLKTCHSELQLVFQEIIKHFDCVVIEGHRGEAAQNKAYESGHSQKKWPDGNHNKTPSHAVDVAPLKYGKIDWNDSKLFYYFAGHVMNTALWLFDAGKMVNRMRFGGDWNRNHDLHDQKLFDLVHFELVAP